MTRVTVYLKDNPNIIVFKTHEVPSTVRNELMRLIRQKSVFQYTAATSMVILNPDLIVGLHIEST